MTIYQIQQDGFKYKEFSLDQDDYLDFVPEDSPHDIEKLMRFGLHNLEMKSWWQELTANFSVPRGLEDRPIADISIWVEACIVLSAKAHETLREPLSSYGEFLPIKFESETFYIFNPLVFGLEDEINSKKEILEGKPVGVDKLQFNTQDVEGKLVFKTKFDACSNLYCNDAFMDLCQKNNLKGLIFQESF